MPLMRAINDYVAATLLGLSRYEVTSILNAQYTVDSIVSFARTHFVVTDLIVCSELIEASTLLRKPIRTGRSPERNKRSRIG
jgi:hypothetical protein